MPTIPKEVREIATQYHMSIDYINHLSNFLDTLEISKILKLGPSNIKTTIRFNLMKSNQSETVAKLRAENISVKAIGGIPEAFEVIKGKNKIGHSLTYLSGEIMPQGYGSMLSVHILDPLPNETILDLSAAPGGKSCFIGERMRGKGVLIANEYSHSRAKSLINNLSRHGISNSVVTIQEGSKFTYPSKFDKILLDAPCSGDGLIVSQPNVRPKKTLENSYILQRVQQSLLKHAISLLKPDGICVYSTCSLNTIENEEVIQPFLNKIQIENIPSPGIPGNKDIHDDFYKTTRLLPSKLGCDGFFIAKLRKI